MVCKKINIEEVADIKIIVELFYRKCRASNLSEKTIVSYKIGLNDFIKTCNIQKIDDVNLSAVEEYVIFKQNHSRASDITINSYLRTIRAFCNWCFQNDYIPEFIINSLKTEKKIKETYSDKELRILLKKPNLKKVNFNEYKTWVLINYLVGTGNRISTALNLKIKDLDFDNNYIMLRKAKNRKQQIIPMSSVLSEILKEYFLIRKGTDEDYVFCNSFGEKADLRTMQEMIAKYNNSRGITKTSAHLFRHTFAKNWVMNGGDVFRLQKILGHSDIKVTKEYVEMFSTDIATDFDKYNPLNKLNNSINHKLIRM